MARGLGTLFENICQANAINISAMVAVEEDCLGIVILSLKDKNIVSLDKGLCSHIMNESISITNRCVEFLISDNWKFLNILVIVSSLTVSFSGVWGVTA